RRTPPRGRSWSAKLPERSARAGGSDAEHASTALRRPPKEKVPFSPLRRQYGGVPAARQSVGGRARPPKWTDRDGLARPTGGIRYCRRRDSNPHGLTPRRF